MTDPVAANLDAYQHGIEAYLGDQAPWPSEAYERYLDTVAGLLPTGSTLLELGSGPGEDALYYEGRGIAVVRTDGTPAFVDRLRAQGYSARLLEVTTAALGGPWDAVFANAVLLHLTVEQLTGLLRRIRGSLTSTGVFAFTVKEGDGSAWSAAKIGHPRFFVYWRAAALRTLLIEAGFSVVSLQQVQGRVEPWLYVICRPEPARAARESDQ